MRMIHVSSLTNLDSILILQHRNYMLNLWRIRNVLIHNFLHADRLFHSGLVSRNIESWQTENENTDNQLQYQLVNQISWMRLLQRDLPLRKLNLRVTFICQGCRSFKLNDDIASFISAFWLLSHWCFLNDLGDLITKWDPSATIHLRMHLNYNNKNFEF